MEFAPGGNRHHHTCAHQKIAEMLAGLALGGVTLQQRREGLDDGLLADILPVQLAQTLTVKAGAQVQVVLAGRLAVQADFGDVRPRAAVR